MRNKMLPGYPSIEERRQKIVDFWVQLSMGGDSGGTTWEVLDPLRNRTTECLMADDIRRAERYTAQAMSLISS